MDAAAITREKLAALVLNLLETQQEYFRTKRHDLLLESKQKERNLKRLCGEILAPPAKPRATLFDEEPTP